MAKFTHKVIASLGEYKDRLGETRKQWHTCGKAMDYGDGSFAVKLDVIPASPEWSGWFKLVLLDEDNRQQPQQRQAAPQQRQASPPPQRQAAPAPSAAQDEEDEIPF
jgi:hypothetical protein